MELINALNRAHKRVYGYEPFFWEYEHTYFRFPDGKEYVIDGFSIEDLAEMFFDKSEHMSIIIEEILKAYL